MTRRPVMAVGAIPAMLLALLLTAAALVTAPVTALPTGPAYAAVAAETPALPVKVTLDSVTPTGLTPDTTLVVDGHLTNTGRTTVTSPQVVLRLDWRNLSDRRELAAWAALDPRASADGTKMAGLPLGRSLAPGESVPFEISVDGDAVQLPVSADGFGPRGLAIEIQTGPPSGGTRVGIVRSFAVWSPVRQYAPTRLALLVPVGQGRQPVDPSGKGAQVRQLWAADGRLSRLLTATADPAFSYALDPSLLTAATRDQTRQPGRPRGAPYAGSTASSPSPSTSAAASPGPSGTSALGATGPADNPFDPAVAAAARTMLGRLTGSTTGREVFTLPYADPDVASLSAGYRRALAVADEEADEVTRGQFGSPLAGGLVWPAQSRADAATAGLAADVPGRRLILPSSAAAEEGRTTPVHARISLPNGTADTLFTDDALSSALAATGGPDPVLAAQRLLAETAAITATHPTEPAVVIATVPRDWDPDAAGVTSSLSALRVAPWVQPARVSAALDTPATPLPRGRLATPSVAPSPASLTVLPTSHVRIIDAQLHRLDRFAPVLTPAGRREFLGPFRRSALEMLSTSWIARQRGVGPARGILTTEVGGVYQGVTIVAGSSTNLLARTGQLPVTVDNHLPVPVRVALRLHPTSGRVIVKRPVEVVIEAGKSRTVRVQLEAVANGDVKIESSLWTAAGGGTQIGSAPPITVRVHYDWESRGLRWIAAVLVLLLVAGLFRSMRRGRVRVSPESVPDPDDVGREPPTPSAGTAVRPPTGSAGLVSGAPGATDAGFGHLATPARHAARGRADGGVVLAARVAPAGPSDPPTGGPGDGSGDNSGDEGAYPADASGDSGARSLFSSSAVMAAGTLTSRVLGLVRAVVLAWAIGQQGLSADAFAIANTLPNSLLAIVAGGALNAVLVPQIVRAAKRSDGGQDYLDRLVTLALLVLGGATVLATLAAPLFVWLYGGSAPRAQVELTTAFAVWCLPQIFFYGLYTVYGQILNARGSFGPYMWAPVVNNVVAIAGTLVFVVLCGSGTKAPEWWGAGPVTLLAGAATLGIVAQALVLLPALRRSGYVWHPRWGWRGVGLRTAGTVAVWTFAGAAVGQLVGFVFISRAANRATVLGAAEGLRVPGRFVYDNAFLLFMLPHSLVAVSLVTAVFTRMSVSASAGRTDDVRDDASLAVRLTGVATVLATAAIVVLGRDLARAIWIGNPVSETDAVALVTMTMALGLVPFSAQYLFSRIFYAYEDARTPFWIQVAMVGFWAAGSTLSAATLPPAAIVPAVGLFMSGSNLLGAGLSLAVLRRRLGGLDGARLLRTHVRLGVAAVGAGVAGWATSAGLHAVLGDGRGVALAVLAGAGAVMLAGYALLLRLMHVAELDLVLAPVTRKLPAGLLRSSSRHR